MPVILHNQVPRSALRADARDSDVTALFSALSELNQLVKDNGLAPASGGPDPLDVIAASQYGPPADFDPENFKIFAGGLLTTVQRAIEQGKLEGNLLSRALNLIQTIAPLLRVAGMAAL